VGRVIDWDVAQRAPVDLPGMFIEGGTDVTVVLSHFRGLINNLSFKLDGNTTIRVFALNPILGGEDARVVAERL
jgi:hypothetical protein